MLKTISVFCISCFVVFILYLVYLNAAFHQPLRADHSRIVVTVKVYPHANLFKVGQTLQKQHLWNHSVYGFVALGQWYGFAKRLHFGEYTITTDLSAQGLLNHIALVTGLTQHELRIPEGATLKQVMLLIKGNANIFKTKERYMPHVNSLCAPLLSTSPSLEGLLYPDTYQFTWGTRESAVIRYAYCAMVSHVTAIWQARDQSIPITHPYELIIVASLIETEANQLQERPIIAAVIYNRLKHHMRLQIDPTVMYGLGMPYGSALKLAQLKIDTPYNTYTIQGLPPTPIAMPSLTALQAAAHPADTAALYYVATGMGSHVFSDTYAEHEKAVAQYRRHVQAHRLQQAQSHIKQVTNAGLIWLWENL